MKLIGDKYKFHNVFRWPTESGYTEVNIGVRQPLWWRLRWWFALILFIAVTAYKIHIGDFQF